MKRDWAEAHNKVAREGRCRVCGDTAGLDPAHVVPRSRVPGPEAMDARNIVPLCREHHQGFDARRSLDLLPYLTLDEQSFAAGLVGLWEAVERATNRRSGL